ncbi:hypothetical protein TWF718_002938 [Orbilia javanica]|uniref:Uncharacterized protein n=1 Tax=Orbilia javanica TaxID=47235 RepID=A0AAN8RBP0_9PEZI
MAYWRSSVSAIWIVSSLIISLSLVTWKNHQFYGEIYVSWVRDYGTYVSIVARVLSGILAKGQTYVAESLVVFATNFRLLSDFSSKKPISLDNLKLRQAMKERSIIFEWGNRRKSFISIAWLLFWQIPAVLWVGSITPVIRTARNPGIKVAVPVPRYSEGSRNFWATICPPTQVCAEEIFGSYFYQGYFSYAPWKNSHRTGLLVNAISQASSPNSSTPRTQKLDNTGYTYRGRSYGVAASVGLTTLRIISEADKISVPSIDFIRSYTYYEDGYHAEVSCQKNPSSQLSFSKLDSVQTPSDTLSTPQGYWVGGSLPNGEWKGFPTWGIQTNEYISVLAAVISKDRYMYGFLAGSKYPNLQNTECEVTFAPTKFNVSVDLGTKEITVTPVLLQDGSKPASIDIDPDRAIANNSFIGASYLSQSSTTLYTSVLGDAFNRNIYNVHLSNNQTSTSPTDILEGTTKGLELLLDSFLGSVGAAQLMLAFDSKETIGEVTLDVVQLGNSSVATWLLGVVGVISVGTILLLAVLWRKGCSSGLRDNMWECFSILLGDRDFLDYKSAIAGVAKGASFGYTLEAIENWDGSSEDMKVGKLEVSTVGDIGLRLNGKLLSTSSNYSSSSGSLPPQV